MRAIAPAPPETVPLTVAARDLTAGTTLGSEDLTTVRVHAAILPAGALADPAGDVLASPLRRGEAITDRRVVGPGLRLAAPGLVALPVRLPDPAMAGLLEPGDRIDLFAVDPGGDTGGADGAEPVASDVLVLAVPAPDGAASGAAVTGGLGGRLIVIGVAAWAVAGVTAASVRSFLTYAYAP